MSGKWTSSDDQIRRNFQKHGVIWMLELEILNYLYLRKKLKAENLERFLRDVERHLPRR
jgi:hypothetical protein